MISLHKQGPQAKKKLQTNFFSFELSSQQKEILFVKGKVELVKCGPIGVQQTLGRVMPEAASAEGASRRPMDYIKRYKGIQGIRSPARACGARWPSLRREGASGIRVPDVLERSLRSRPRLEALGPSTRGLELGSQILAFSSDARNALGRSLRSLPRLEALGPEI